MNRRLSGKLLLGGAIVTGLLGSVYWARNNSTLFNLFFPPSGLYEPLAENALEDGAKMYSFEVMHSYPGQYEVAVRAPSVPGVGVDYKMSFTANVVLKSDSEELMRQTVVEPYSQFWGKDYGGVVLLNYRVPEQVPKDKPTHVTVNISGDVEEFNMAYGASTLVIKKRSDK